MRPDVSTVRAMGALRSGDKWFSRGEEWSSVTEEPRWKMLQRLKLRAIETSQAQWLPDAKSTIEFIAVTGRF
jgi:hypothetical protein